MKNKLLITIIILLSLFTVVGCTKKEEKTTKTKEKDVVKTKLSCSKEFYLFHSKKSVEYIIYLDKDNKLIGFDEIDKYYEFDNDNEFNSICEVAPEEAVNNTKIFKHLTEKAECNQDTREVTIYDEFDISKLNSKETIPSDVAKENIDNNYILNLDNYKNEITSKGYTCK